MYEVGGGGGHDAQGNGFHCNFHLGPAIVFSSESNEKGLYTGTKIQPDSKWQRYNSMGAKCEPLKKDLGTSKLVERLISRMT